MEVKSPNVEVSAVLGTHLDGRTHDDVKNVYIFKQLVLFPPVAIGKFFAKIESYQINNCNLKQIKRSDFAGMENLKEIDFMGNKIEEIPDGTFDDLVELELIQLSENLIAKLPDGIFENLANLEELRLRDNKVEELSASLFTKNFKLRFISLDSNNLIYVEPKTFAHLSKLEVLAIHSNPCNMNIDEKKLPDELAELDAFLSENCNQNCEDIPEKLSLEKKNFMSCEMEYERIVQENIEMKNHEKACLLL